AVTPAAKNVLDQARSQAGPTGHVPTLRELGVGEPADVAELLVFLVSDEARSLNGQILSFNGHRLGLWSHPRVVNVEERDRWTLDDLVRDFHHTVGRDLQAIAQPL